MVKQLAMATSKSNTITKGKKGRPAIYSQSLAVKICEQIATTPKSMKTICKELNISVATVLNWITVNHANYREEFDKQYARAKEMQADMLAEEILEIADKCRMGKKTKKTKDGTETTTGDMVERSRLQIDARKWMAGKLRPKKYGDSIDVTSGGDKLPPSAFTVVIVPPTEE